MHCICFVQYIISAISKFLQVTQFSENFSKLHCPSVPMLCGKFMLTNNVQNTFIKILINNVLVQLHVEFRTGVKRLFRSGAERCIQNLL